MEILTFVVKVAYCMFFAGAAMFSVLYTYLMACTMYLGRNDPPSGSNGYWFGGGKSWLPEACATVNKRLVKVIYIIIFIMIFQSVS